MPISGIDHLNIRTPRFAETIVFLRDHLGMIVAPIPGRETIEEAAWVLDDQGAAILHLARADIRYSATEILPDNPPRGSGAVHHVALTCSDYEGMKRRLTVADVPFRENQPAAGVRQIFVCDPSDIRIELNFSGG